MTITEPLAVTGRREIAGSWLARFEAAVQAGDTQAAAGTGGGYYINVGCSDLIVTGKIAVKHGAEIAGLDRRTVRFTDGTAMDTDMIVVAAGYQNMSESVRASSARCGGQRRAGVGP